MIDWLNLMRGFTAWHPIDVYCMISFCVIPFFLFFLLVSGKYMQIKKNYRKTKTQKFLERESENENESVYEQKKSRSKESTSKEREKSTRFILDKHIIQNWLPKNWSWIIALCILVIVIRFFVHSSPPSFPFSNLSRIIFKWVANGI